MYIYSHFKISTQTNISDKNAIKLLRPKSYPVTTYTPQHSSCGVDRLQIYFNVKL